MNSVVDLQKALYKFYEKLAQYKPENNSEQMLMDVVRVDFDLNIRPLLVELFCQEKVIVDRKQLTDKLIIAQEMWDTAKATSDDRVLTVDDEEVLERYEYVGNTLAYATGQIRLLKELVGFGGEQK